MTGEERSAPQQKTTEEPTQANGLLRLGALLDKKFEDTGDIIGGGILRLGSELVIGGAPKLGKSFIAASTMFSLVTGRPFLGVTRRDKHGQTVPAFPVRGGMRCLYIEKEVGEQDCQARFARMLSGLPPDEQALCRENILISSMDYDAVLDRPAGIRRLEAYIKAAGLPEIVVLDPWTKMFLGSENDDESVRACLFALGKLRRAFSFAVIIVHHVTKPSEMRSGLDMLRGHGGLAGDLDTALLVSGAPHGLLKCESVLRRGAPIDPFYVRRNPNTLLTEFVQWSRRGREEEAEKNGGVSTVL